MSGCYSDALIEPSDTLQVCFTFCSHDNEIYNKFKTEMKDIKVERL
jgi:hypothetical protein